MESWTRNPSALVDHDSRPHHVDQREMLPLKYWVVPPRPEERDGASGSRSFASGCWTCRIRGRNCDEEVNSEGWCQMCVQSRIQCLGGYGIDRWPEWMVENGHTVTELRERIDVFLEVHGKIDEQEEDTVENENVWDHTYRGQDHIPLDLESPVVSNSRSLTYEDQLNHLLFGLRNLDLTDDLYGQTEFFDAHGGFCDVFKAKSKRYNGMDVAVKRLRVHIFRNKDVSKMIFRELKVWSELRHENVLPLLGYAMHGQYPAMVSKWIVNGSLRTYMENDFRMPMLRVAEGVANGLSYLHDKNVIHSDLKCDNILMSDSGEPLLADFGISRVMTNTSVTTATSAKGSTRWMAIELWPSMTSDEDAEGKHTKQTDVWAFGMVIYELLTGNVPFYEIKNDVRVSFVIAQGQLPSTPTSMNETDSHFPSAERELWAICRACWRSDPRTRPEIKQIYLQLSTGLNGQMSLLKVLL